MAAPPTGYLALALSALGWPRIRSSPSPPGGGGHAIEAPDTSTTFDPPSTTRTAPVMKDESSLARKVHALRDQQALGERSQLPEDRAGPVLFLASEDSDFVTAHTLVVNGGVVCS